MQGQALLAALPEPPKGASPPPVTILRAGKCLLAADAASPAPAGLGASPSAYSKGLPPKIKTKFPKPAISFRSGSPRSPFPLAHPGLADGQEAVRCFRNERHQTMSETTPDTDARSTRNPQREPHPHSPNRSHHQGRNPSRRPPMSREQRQKVSAAQKAYVATDPRWAAHRQKLAEAQIARRMTLTPEEFELVLKMRAKGRTFSYIEAEIGVCHDVIRRALAERGYSTAPIRKERRAKRGTGYWRSFD